MLVFDADGLSWLHKDVIMKARTFSHGDTQVMFIQVEALWAGAAIDGQEVSGAALCARAQRHARLLASLQLVGVDLSGWAALGVSVCCQEGKSNDFTLDRHQSSGGILRNIQIEILTAHVVPPSQQKHSLG